MLKVQCKRRYRLLKFWQFNAYKNDRVRDYNELLPGSHTSQTQINPAPGTRSKGGEAMLRCFREEEEKTRDARKNLFIWITILSSNDSNGFTSFKIIKAAVLNTVTRVALFCISLSLSLSLSFRSSDQLQQTVPIIHLFSHSNEKHYKWTRVRLLCYIEALIRIKPYIKS